MDTYIKMCDTPEIQDKWKPKVGDRAVRVCEYPDYSLGLVCWNWRQGYSELTWMTNNGWDGITLKDPDNPLERLIILPYQHQIQEMYADWLWENDGSITKEYALKLAVWNFGTWLLEDYIPEENGIKTYPLNVFANGEETAIAFLMHEVHNKIWKDKWV